MLYSSFMKRFLAFIVSLFFFNTVVSQNDDRFVHLSVKEGLSNGRVVSIVQDSLGFVWIGTKNGLNRYDGSSFKKYNQKNSGLSSNDVSSLLVDNKGLLWIGTTEGGVNVYDPKKDRFEVFQNTGEENKRLSSNEVHTIKSDQKGNIWIGTKLGIDLFNRDRNRFETYQYYLENGSALNFLNVWSIAEDFRGNLILGTYENGIYQFDTKTRRFEKYQVGSNFNEKDHTLKFINDLFYLSERDLLVGTNGDGLFRLNIDTGVLSHFFENYPEFDAPMIRKIYRDTNQNIWVGTDGDGIVKIEQKKYFKWDITQYLHDNRLRFSLANNTVNAIFEDNQSNIWIGTAWGGINIFEKKANNNSFYFSDGIGYNPSPILSVLKEGEELWTGTNGNGLNNYNTKTKQNTRFHDKSKMTFDGDFVQLIKKRTNNTYWIGTFANGLFLFDPVKGIRKRYNRGDNSNALSCNDVRDVIEVTPGKLWVGTWGGGLSFLDLDKETFKNYRHSENMPNTLSSNDVVSMSYDEKGLLWMGTYGGGLNRFDLKSRTFQSFKTFHGAKNELEGNFIFDLFDDKRGTLWLGTKSGLKRFDKKTEVFEHFTVGNNTNSNTVVSLIGDEFGNIWMGTKAGVFKYNRQSKKIQRIESEINEFHIGAVCTSPEGELFFGGAEGVISFSSKRTVHQKTLPKLLFTELKLFDKLVNVGDGSILKSNISLVDEITLNHKQDVISFGFSVLKYPFSATEYKIKMEGFEDHWREIGSEGTATYTNLSPGKYIFKVQSDGVGPLSQSESYAELRVEVLPPFWMTWWAYLIDTIIFLVIIWFVRHYTLAWMAVKNNLRLEKLQREQEDKIHKLKQRFFTNISHEIRTPLTLITGTINSLMKSNVSSREQKQFSNLRRSTGRLMNLVSELLNIRKLETGNTQLHVSKNDIVLFIHEIFLAFSQHAIGNNITYKFNKPNNPLHVWFDKIQLEKTIYNLLTNAFKFTSSGDGITVSVLPGNENVNILVEDTGKGIPYGKLSRIFDRFYQNEDTIVDSTGFGIGLSIAKDIVELHSGSIQVKSELEKGSCFTITLPLGKEHFKSEQIASDKINDENSISNYRSDSHRDFDTEGFYDAKILIVEDNIHLLNYLKELLSQNFETITAENGKVGYELATKELPDVVVSDVMMPVMDGIRLCSKLKSSILTSHIPVILLTARAMVENIMEGFETGADDYLVKPFNENVLMIRIKNLLISRKQLREKYTHDLLLSPREMSFISPDQEFLMKLNDLIERNISNLDFNIEKLAIEMAMSHSNLYKKIKALTGMTTVGFVRDFKLKRAAQLLKQNKIAIIDVCFRVGYTDRRHFSQEFKKKFKMTPSAYAKENLV